MPGGRSCTSSDDEEQYLAAYEEADRHAAGVLREALAGIEIISPSAAEIAIAAERLRREPSRLGGGRYPAGGHKRGTFRPHADLATPRPRHARMVVLAAILFSS